ncbi:uncharacterized protein [Nicotiana tomentosiformis]|uniref:uncharacterized protein n=1 Tax=Nicotiana tomentosiformis TaxID=4098 RepID=UPI00388C349A
MEKTSKTVLQKEAPSTSQPATEPEETFSRAAVNEAIPEPPLKMFIPEGCSVNADFKGEKPSSVQGLSKDAKLRPPSSGENLPAKSHVPRQAEEKKRKSDPISPSSEKKKTRRRLVRKTKEGTSARAPPSDSLYRPRDESKEEEKEEVSVLIASVLSRLEGQGASEPENLEADLPQGNKVDEEAEAEASRDAGSAPKKALNVIDITESPSFTKSMYNELETVKERPNERARGADDTFRSFFDGVDSTATEDVTGLGDLEVSMLHHETFLRYRNELNQLEAEVRGLTEKRDTYKLLSEQHERETKSLRAELEVARKDHADLVEYVKIFEVSDDDLDTVTNGRNLRDQQKIDWIDQLCAEMDAVKVETEEWRGKIDRLAWKKETVRTQLTSAEVQIRATKEKAKVQAQKIKEIHSQLSSVVSDRENLAKKLKALSQWLK